VEDEEAVQKLARQFLEISSYTVLEACDADEAIQLSEQHQGMIHLMVTDIVMPKRSGQDLAQQLAAARPEMKVIYISGYTDKTISQPRALDRRTAFLQKPFSLDALAGKVREVLEQ
jgi:DNA-binding NtrC family response regulator